MDIAQADVDELQRALKTAPAYLSTSDVLSSKPDPGNIVSAHGASDGGNLPGGTTSQWPQQNSQTGQQPAQQKSLGSRAMRQAAPTIVSHPQASTNVAMASLSDPRYLYLCLRSGSTKHVVLELRSSDLESDEAFFHAMRQKYTQSRGSISRWLGWASWWRYDHCEFYSVSSFIPRTIPRAS
jgi:hypothetical protein